MHEYRTYYFGGFFLVALFHGMLFLFNDDRYTNVHIHYHHWAFLVTIFCRCDVESCVAMQALTIGIWVHGIAVFGCEPLYSRILDV